MILDPCLEGNCRLFVCFPLLLKRMRRGCRAASSLILSVFRSFTRDILRNIWQPNYLPSLSLSLSLSPLAALVCLAGETIYSSLERRILVWTIGAYSLELLSSASFCSSPAPITFCIPRPVFPFAQLSAGEGERERRRIAQGAADEDDDNDDEPDLIRCLIKNMA